LPSAMSSLYSTCRHTGRDIQDICRHPQHQPGISGRSCMQCTCRQHEPQRVNTSLVSGKVNRPA
jgi:hypothetical protein